MALLVTTLIAPSPGAADEDRSRFIVRPEVYERLTKSQDHLNAKRYDEAIRELTIVQKRMKPNQHEKALTLQALGYVYLGQDKKAPALAALGEAYDIGELPKATLDSMLYTMGQIHLSEERYLEASKRFDQWLASAENPSADAVYTAAAAKYKAKDVQGAITLGKRAVAAQRRPKDAHLQLLLAAYIETKRYGPASEIQKQFVERYPAKRLEWMQLAALLSEAKKEDEALAALQLARFQGVFEEKQDWVQLAQRFMGANAPALGARALEDAISAKVIPLDAEVAALLANAWYLARDAEKAAPALTRAAQIAKDGKLYLRLAQLEVERERWGAAVEAGNKAVAAGKLDDPGAVHLLVGIAETRRGRPAAAREAFERAAKSPSSKKAAVGWMKYLSNLAANAPGNRE